MTDLIHLINSLNSLTWPGSIAFVAIIVGVSNILSSVFTRR